jgi:hypothetical protein
MTFCKGYFGSTSPGSWSPFVSCLAHDKTNSILLRRNDAKKKSTHFKETDWQVIAKSLGRSYQPSTNDVLNDENSADDQTSSTTPGFQSALSIMGKKAGGKSGEYKRKGPVQKRMFTNPRLKRMRQD